MGVRVHGRHVDRIRTLRTYQTLSTRNMTTTGTLRRTGGRRLLRGCRGREECSASLMMSAAFSAYLMSAILCAYLNAPMTRQTKSEVYYACKYIITVVL